MVNGGASAVQPTLPVEFEWLPGDQTFRTLLQVTTYVAYRPLPLDQSDVRYLHGPDSVVHDDVAAGETIEFHWDESTTYPGTRANSGFTCLPSTLRQSRRR